MYFPFKSLLIQTGGAWLKFRKEESGLLNDGLGCQPHPMAFVKTPVLLCPMQHHGGIEQ
jgi:hypothetical protein